MATTPIISISLNRDSGSDVINIIPTPTPTSNIPFYAWSAANQGTDLTHDYSDGNQLLVIYTLTESPTLSTPLFLVDGTQIFPTYFIDVDADERVKYCTIANTTGIGFSSDPFTPATLGQDHSYLRDSTKDITIAPSALGPKLYAWTTSNTSTATAYDLDTTFYTLTPAPRSDDFITNHDGNILVDENGNNLTWHYFMEASVSLSSVSSSAISFATIGPA